MTYRPTGRPPGRPRKPVVDPNAPPPPPLIQLPAIFLDGIDANDPEKRQRAALGQLMEALHTQMPLALAKAAEKKPELVVQFYRDMVEYAMPKLSRLDQNVNANIAVTHFVAVEDREVDPRTVLPPIDVVPSVVS